MQGDGAVVIECSFKWLRLYRYIVGLHRLSSFRWHLWFVTLDLYSFPVIYLIVSKPKFRAAVLNEGIPCYLKVVKQKLVSLLLTLLELIIIIIVIMIIINIITIIIVILQLYSTFSKRKL